MTESNTFAGAALDRVALRRCDEAWLADAAADPAARAVLVAPDGVVVTGGDRPRAVLAPLARAGASRVLLGRRDGAVLFAAPPRDGALPDGARVAGLRDVAAALPGPDAALLAYASAMTTWHRRTRFCGTCGRPTAAREAGHVLVCAEGHAHHPRTDAVVIMLVTDGDRALLGRQPHWPPGRWSALAGFVEPGESLEEAVAREVEEEAGIAVGAVHYRSSQPWPFPMNLMIGFHAEWARGEPEVRDRELEAVRFFGREELAAAVARSDASWSDADADADGVAPLRVPPRHAIARRLVEDWLAGGASS